MPKLKPTALHHIPLPGVECDESIPRPERLKIWMRRQGWTFAALAKAWDCHWTFPGKCLSAETEELPWDKREWLVEQGFPDELLPPPWDESRRRDHNRDRRERQKASRIRGQAEAFLEARRKFKEGE